MNRSSASFGSGLLIPWTLRAIAIEPATRISIDLPCNFARLRMKMDTASLAMTDGICACEHLRSIKLTAYSRFLSFSFVSFAIVAIVPRPQLSLDGNKKKWKIRGLIVGSSCLGCSRWSCCWRMEYYFFASVLAVIRESFQMYHVMYPLASHAIAVTPFNPVRPVYVVMKPIRMLIKAV